MFGEVRSATILRLLQETATRASSDAGFDAAYYERAGTLWLIRRTIVSLGAPARYGDTLEVRTWIADFRRVRSQREYEVWSGGHLVARASSDWVHIERRTGRPRRVPEEWQQRFPCDPADASRRVAFAESAAPPGAVTFERRIELHELDALQHVNNANYVSYLEQAALDAASARGWTPATQAAAGGRLRAVHHDVEYLDAVLYGEHISVTTWPVRGTAEGIERHTHLHRGDPARPLLQARSRYVWIGQDGAPAALPPDLRTTLDAP